MGGNIEHEVAQQAPCALQHYLHLTKKHNPSNELSQYECQMAFQHWVAYTRPRYQGVSAREHLKCPLLGCGDSFENLASALHHVSTCPWLPNAWYWCPSCCRPERFMDNKATTEGVPHNVVQRKASKIRRAVTFFKHFGLKSHSRGKRSTSSDPCRTSAPDNRAEKSLISRDDLESIPDPAELDSSWIEKLFEMDDTTTHVPHGADIRAPYTSQIDTDLGPRELSTGEFDEAPPYSLPAGSSARFLPGVGAQFTDNYTNSSERPTSNILFSPIPVGGDLPVSQNMAPGVPSLGSSPMIHSTVGHSTSAQWTTGGRKWNHNNIVSIIDEDSATTQPQVDDLREVVRVLNEEWKERLISNNDLILACSGFSARSIFETGARAIQHCFRGTLPRTFQEVFALIHVACACTYILHKDDDLFSWDVFIDAMMQWQYAILDESDIWLFERVVNRLCSPQGVSTMSSQASCHSNGSSYTLPPKRRYGYHAAADATFPPKQQVAAVSNPARLLDSLMNGQLIKECSRFLDGLEHAAIIERNRDFPTHLAWYAQNHVTNIADMMDKMIKPLKHWSGFESHQEAIAAVESQVRDGSLRNPREVETTLVSSCRWYCNSASSLETYVAVVATLCDKAMREVAPSWRHRYYATDLDTVLAVSQEIDNRQREPSNNSHKRSNNGPPPRAGPQQPLNGSSPLISSDTQALTSSSPSTTSFKTPLNSTPTDTTGNFVKSPTGRSRDSPRSPLSFASPTTLAGTISCPICPASPENTFQNQSNLQRHLRYSRKHNDGPRLKCEVERCNATLGRSDNLGKHLQMVHGINTPLRRQGARKRRREDENMDSL